MPGQRSYGGEWYRARRSLGAYRRLTAAVLAAVATVLAISAARPRPGPTEPVWVAARDLPGGAPLRAGDLRRARLPLADVPAHSLAGNSALTGRFLAAPVRRGEPLTDVRLLSPALLAATGSPGALAIPVRVTDPAAALALIQAGDRIDVLAGADPSIGSTAPTGPVVQDVRVLAVSSRTPADGTGLVIVAASATQAAAIAALPAGDQVSIALLRSSSTPRRGS